MKHIPLVAIFNQECLSLSNNKADIPLSTKVTSNHSQNFKIILNYIVKSTIKIYSDHKNITCDI